MTSNIPGEPSDVFRPEFINRIDDIIRFRSLGREDLAQIVEVQLAHLHGRLAARRLGLEISEAAKVWVADRGYDPVFGARPLKRVIQREIADPLAKALLDGRYAEGSVVRIDVSSPDATALTLD